MGATLVGLAFLLLLVLGGVPVSRLLAQDEQPIALGSTLALGATVVLTANLASLFGYQAWMALLAWIVLPAAGWAVARRVTLSKPSTLPNGPRLTLFLLVTALALITPLLVLPVPMDTDAQGFGYLSLMIQKGGTVDTLAPWRPDISYLYSPGALLIFAALSSLFSGVPMSAVMMGASHAGVFIFVCLAWEFGGELCRHHPDNSEGRLTPRNWQWATAIGAAGSVGLWTALMDSHYTAVFGSLFVLAFLNALARLLRTGGYSDAVAAAVFLAAVALTHPDSAIIAALGFGAFLVSLLWSANRSPWRLRILMTVGVPVGAVLLGLPWLVRIWPLLGSAIRSPFEVSISNWRPLLLYHGLIWPMLALVGAVVRPCRRTIWTSMMAVWLATIVEFGLLGLANRAFPTVLGPFVRFHYPFSLAWHGPIIPYMVLGAGCLVWLSGQVDRRYPARLMDSCLIATIIAIFLALGVSSYLPDWTRGLMPFQGCFATPNDLLAMRWLRENAPRAARVLNYPGDYTSLRDWEGHWVPVITEHDSVYFRSQPFYAGRGLATARAEEAEMLAFWRDPANPDNARRLRAAGLQFVIVPESVGDPASQGRSWRWQPPAELCGIVAGPESASYLKMVFRAGGAVVYQVRPAEEGKTPE